MKSPSEISALFHQARRQQATLVVMLKSGESVRFTPLFHRPILDQTLGKDLWIGIDEDESPGARAAFVLRDVDVADVVENAKSAPDKHPVAPSERIMPPLIIDDESSGPPAARQ